MQGKKASGIPFASPLAVVATFLCAFVASAFPLTGTPGPEAAQLLALIGGPSLLLAGAARGAARLGRGFIGDLSTQALLLAVVFVGFIVIIALASFNHESCAPGRGWLPFVSLALPVLILNSALGLWIGRLLGHARIAVAVSALLLGGYVLWLAADWLYEPSFRMLTHLLVVVEGDMLRGRALSPAGWAYRMATLMLGLGLCFAGASRFPRKRSGGLSAAPSSNPGFLLAAATLIAIGVATHWQATDVIAPSRDDLETTYSLQRSRGPLVVRADPSVISGQEVDAILAEGTLWLDRLARRLGVTAEKEIVIWLHADSSSLGYWTGADHVHFALPMHSELHVAGSDTPHRSLGHELVHILGAQVSDTLLGVPGRFGLLVNSGLIEGLAMAMTPELETGRGLTLREKAAAMRRAELAPPAAELFQEYGSMFAFWRHNPGRAYITAGALMEALAAQRGVEGLQAVYREGDLLAGFDSQEALDAFIAAHEADLDAMELPPGAVAAVARSYARPSILDETCDRERMQVAQDIEAAARSGDFQRAETLARAAEEAITGATYVALAAHAEALGNDERSTYYRLRSTRTADTRDPIEIGSRLAAAGDAFWRVGKRREAIVLWERVHDEDLPPYPRRLLVAKRWLAGKIRARGNQAPLAAASLDLVLQDNLTMDGSARLAKLSAALAQDDGRDKSVTGFARYLLGRQYLQRGALDEGLDLLLRAIEDRLPPSPFDEEVFRSLAMGHARRGDLAIAAVGFAQIADDASRSAVRTLMRDRAERAKKMLESAGQGGVIAGDQFLLGRGRRGGM